MYIFSKVSYCHSECPLDQGHADNLKRLNSLLLLI